MKRRRRSARKVDVSRVYRVPWRESTDVSRTHTRARVNTRVMHDVEREPNGHGPYLYQGPYRGTIRLKGNYTRTARPDRRAQHTDRTCVFSAAMIDNR